MKLSSVVMSGVLLGLMGMAMSSCSSQSRNFTRISGAAGAPEDGSAAPPAEGGAAGSASGLEGAADSEEGGQGGQAGQADGSPGSSSAACSPRCSGATPVCVAGVCRACESDSDCSGSTPACDPSGACAECSESNLSLCADGKGDCRGAKCTECVPGDLQCSENQPQKCNSLGQWKDGAVCSAAAPTCSAGECVCATDLCSGKCTDTNTDYANCGQCGRQCSTAHASSKRACAASLCAPTCQANFQDCNTPLSPDADDGCECAGTGCCGSGCQTKHSSGDIGGVGFQEFWDCETTVNAQSAMDACNAWKAARVKNLCSPATVVLSCIATGGFVCAGYMGNYYELSGNTCLNHGGCSSSSGLCCNSLTFCWGFVGAFKGNVYKGSGASNFDSCPPYSASVDADGQWN
jgi:hypothetical protein